MSPKGRYKKAQAKTMAAHCIETVSSSDMPCLRPLLAPSRTMMRTTKSNQLIGSLSKFINAQYLDTRLACQNHCSNLPARIADNWNAGPEIKDCLAANSEWRSLGHCPAPTPGLWYSATGRLGVGEIGQNKGWLASGEWRPG